VWVSGLSWGQSRQCFKLSSGSSHKGATSEGDSLARLGISCWGQLLAPTRSSCPGRQTCSFSNVEGNGNTTNCHPLQHRPTRGPDLSCISMKNRYSRKGRRCQQAALQRLGVFRAGSGVVGISVQTSTRGRAIQDRARAAITSGQSTTLFASRSRAAGNRDERD
jgi:hypothetical protein